MRSSLRLAVHFPRAWQRPALILLLALVACSPRITTDWDPGADFTRLRTWAWRPGDQQGPADPRIDNSLLDTRVRNAVERVLASRGYRKITEGDPDFLVGYHVVAEERTDVRTIGGWYGYRGWWVAPTTYAYRYTEGTLLIDVIDPATKRLLWRGTATSTVDPGPGTPQRRERRISQAVERVLAVFPPRSR